MTVTYPYPGETTTDLKDYLGRWLGNATPGTSDATDFLGRNVTAAGADFLGRPLTFADPTAWAATHAYTAGTYASLTGGAVVQVTTAGTSGSTAPTAPTKVGGTVTDGTAVWTRIH